MLPGFIFFCLRGLRMSLRAREVHPERVDRFWKEGRPVIIAFWHQRLLMLPFVYRGRGVKMLISPSRDGEIARRVIEKVGIDTIRGSSSRQGAEALVQMERAIRAGYDVGITPDGPRGPGFSVKPGIIELARRTGAPIVPLAFGAKWKKRLESWDRFEVPVPFSRGVYLWGEPFWVEAGNADPDRKAQELGEKINLATREADELAARPPDLFSEFFFYPAYNILLILFFLLLFPFALLWFLLRPEAREGAGERFGRVARIDPYIRPVWIHCASVGELEAAKPLLRRIISWSGEEQVLLSFTSSTGRRLARKHFPGVRSMFLPFDLPGIVSRTVRKIHPRVLVLFEAELWPNLLRSARKTFVPVLVVNGRISEGSARNYRLIRFFFRQYTSGIRFFGVKEERDRERLILLGVDPERIEVIGNIKLTGGNDDPSSSEVIEEIQNRWRTGPDDLVLVAGSTHRGEEEILLRAFRDLASMDPPLKLVIAPRKISRVREIERLLQRQQLAWWRRSQLRLQNGSPPPVLLLDSMGELREVYSIGFVVFVGGSLVPIGGHNLVEAAARGKPVLFGPHVQKQQEVAEYFITEGFGFQVDGVRELCETVRQFVEHPEQARALGQRAKVAVQREGRILDRYAEQIKPFVQ